MPSVLNLKNVRLAAYAVASVRIGFGVAFTVSPRATARPWLGSALESPASQVITRSMGVRDGLLVSPAVNSFEKSCE